MRREAYSALLWPLRCAAAGSSGVWETPPFEPSERNGNLYARGSADDKGQMYSHIKAVEALQAVYGKIPVNLKFLMEGEEEVGGISVAEYVAETRETEGGCGAGVRYGDV